MTDEGAFTPQWASPPGDTIRAVLAERDMTVGAFADAVGLPPERATAIVKGTEPLSIAAARGISGVLGGSIAFWMTRDCQYRDDLARIDAEHWSRELPTAEAAVFGWIEKPRTSNGRIDTWLRFFDVPDVDVWRQIYLSPVKTAQFRASSKAKLDRNVVAVWLRKGEIDADRVATARWSRRSFQQLLPEVLPLTRQKDPAVFLPKLTQLCASAGVAVSVARAPKGCAVSGAARLLAPTKAQILLSARYLVDDHFWFTFFHEAGHLLLHDSTSLYVDQLDLGPHRSRHQDERQADAFAGEYLLPASLRDELSQPIEERGILKLARASGISPGILVGQLQHEGLVPYRTGLNHLKRRYRWRGASLGKA